MTSLFIPKKYYINPQDKFDNMCIRKHGITADKVANRPTFPEIWKEIEPCFTKSIIIGHNAASADLDALTKNLQRYNIDIPELFYIDTLVIARTFVPSFAVKDYEMSTLCSYFGVDIDNEHDAFDDACSCKGLFLAMKERYSFATQHSGMVSIISSKLFDFNIWDFGKMPLSSGYLRR